MPNMPLEGDGGEPASSQVEVGVTPRRLSSRSFGLATTAVFVAVANLLPVFFA